MNSNMGEKFTFERTNLNSTEHNWELLEPIMPSIRMNQKYFGVARKNNDIIFIGGNLDLEEKDNKTERKSFKYNIENNSIEESETNYIEYNFKEKTFLKYNEKISYIKTIEKEKIRKIIMDGGDTKLKKSMIAVMDKKRINLDEIKTDLEKFKDEIKKFEKFSLIELYWFILRKKHRMISLLIKKDIYDIFSIKLSLLILSYTFDFFVTTLFFFNFEIRKLFHQKRHLEPIYIIFMGLFCTIFSTFLIKVVDFLMEYRTDFRRYEILQKYENKA